MKNGTQTRILTALIAGAFFIYIISYRLGFILCMLILALLGLKEIYAIARKSSLSSIITIPILLSNLFILGLTSYLVLFRNIPNDFILNLSIITGISYFAMGIIGLKLTRFTKGIHYFVSMILYPCWSFALIIAYISQDDTHKYSLLLGILFLIWASDSFAFFIGKSYGRHALYKSISPKKTIEGWMGALLGVLIIAFVNSYALHTSIALWQWIIIGLIVWLMGTWGDLYESVFKRSAGIKDSGTLLPGHGGILDRFDSLIFAFPFIVLFLMLSS